MPINPLFPQASLRFPVKGAQPDAGNLSRQIPAEYKTLLYPFADAWLERHPAADILHQVSTVNGYTISSHVLMAHADVMLAPAAGEPLHLLHFMLKGSIRCSLGGGRSLWLRAGQFGCFRLEGSDNEAWLEKGRTYELFHIDISPARLDELAAFHPAFRQLEAGDARNAFVDAGSGIMPGNVYALIDAIRQLPPSGNMFKLATAARIDLLIAETLSATSAGQDPNRRQGDEILFETIRAYMLHHLADPLHNSEIAAAYCISESKLKTGFRQRFGESPQAWVRHVRMESAAELVRHSAYSLHQVAAMVGYADYSNFSRRFHAHFGHPPSYLKRQ